VAAEEENSFTVKRVQSCAGKPQISAKGSNVFSNISKKPEALRIPTATIRPIMVGMISHTTLNPSPAPFKKVSYTFPFIDNP